LGRKWQKRGPKIDDAGAKVWRCFTSIRDSRLEPKQFNVTQSWRYLPRYCTYILRTQVLVAVWCIGGSFMYLSMNIPVDSKARCICLCDNCTQISKTSGVHGRCFSILSRLATHHPRCPKRRDQESQYCM